jgi:hypothetical protein
LTGGQIGENQRLDFVIEDVEESWKVDSTINQQAELSMSEESRMTSCNSRYEEHSTLRDNLVLNGQQIPSKYSQRSGLC